MARERQLALLFPGQGSQTADMRETVERRRPDLLELAFEEVGSDLFERAADGTRWAQPAIYCAALAGAEELRAGEGERGPVEPDFMAGHSLGEITALVAAGAVGADDGLRLVAARGRLMQEAAEETGDGSMTAVRAREGNRETIAEVAAANDVAIANDNAPDQLVLSGALDALDRAEAELKERGVRSKRLPVAGAFHSPLMEPAVEPFRAVVAGIDFAEPSVPGDVLRDGSPVRGRTRVELVPRAHRAGALARRGARARRPRRHRVRRDRTRDVLTNLVRKSLRLEAAGA